MVDIQEMEENVQATVIRKKLIKTTTVQDPTTS